jgi:hypothetical protein
MSLRRDFYWQRSAQRRLFDLDTDAAVATQDDSEAFCHGGHHVRRIRFVHPGLRMTSFDRTQERLIRLKDLWDEHGRDPFPRGCGGKEIFGVDLVMIDADLAGLAEHVVRGIALSTEQRRILGKIREELKFVVPNVPIHARAYFSRLATIADQL